METVDVGVYAARAIPSHVRREVIARDGMICRSCARPVVRRGTRQPYRPDTLHLDHVLPWSEGGDHAVGNLIVSCADCNLRRPRPTKVIRQSRIRVTHRDGAHWWPNDYVPPRVTAAGDVPLQRFADDLFEGSLVQAVQSIDRGEVAATIGTQIMIELPALLVGAVLRPKPTPSPRLPPRRAPLAPIAEREAYWGELIKARRQREREARDRKRPS